MEYSILKTKLLDKEYYQAQKRENSTKVWIDLHNYPEMGVYGNCTFYETREQALEAINERRNPIIEEPEEREIV
jgi:hypothetical protein